MKAIAWLLVMAAALPVQAAMYKWVDAQGRVQYSDTPPPPGVKVEEQKFAPNTIQTAGTPFAVQEAAKRNPVTLWLSDCGEHCTNARNFLARRGIPHSVRNPSRQSEQEAWKQASGGDNSIPLLVVGTLKKLKGFDEAQWMAALEAAGYPRAAPALKPQPIPNAEPDTVVVPPAGGKPAAAAPGTPVNVAK